MTESIILRIHGNQLRILEETVEAWKEYCQVMPASDVEALVSFCLGYPATMTQLWNSIFDKIKVGEFDDLSELGHSLQGHFDKTVEFLWGVHQWAEQFEGNGQRIKRIAELQTAIAEVQRLRDEILQHWPWFEEKDIEEGLAEHARGECIEVDDAFAAAAGVDKETWLKRVQEHRQRRK